MLLKILLNNDDQSIDHYRKWLLVRQCMAVYLIINTGLILTFGPYCESPWSGNVYHIYGRTTLKVILTCAAMVGNYVLVHNRTTYSMLIDTKLRLTLRSALVSNTTRQLVMSRIKRASMIVKSGALSGAIWVILSVYMRYGLSVHFFITMLRSVDIYSGYMMYDHVVNDMFLLRDTQKSLTVTLNGLIGKLVNLVSETNTRKARDQTMVYISDIIRFDGHMKILNRYWSMAISSAILTMSATTCVGWLGYIAGMPGMALYACAGLSSICFATISAILLTAANVNGRIRKVYRPLTRLCLSTKLGWRQKMKLSRLCTRFQRPFGLVTIDGASIDYMKYNEVRK